MFKPVLYPRRWFVLAAYCFLTISNLSLWCMFSSISNIVQRYYSINLMEVNWLAIFESFVALSMYFPANYFLKHKGFAKIMALSASLNVLGCCIRYVSHSFAGASGYWFQFAGKCNETSMSPTVSQGEYLHFLKERWSEKYSASRIFILILTRLISWKIWSLTLYNMAQFLKICHSTIAKYIKSFSLLRAQGVNLWQANVN